MGATIFPAVEKPYENDQGTTSWYLDSVVERTYIDDPDYGRIPEPTPFEMHLTYSSIYTLLRGFGFDVTNDDYSGSYDIGEFTDAVIDDMLTYDEPTDPDGWLWMRLESLMRICCYGLRHDATHIAWS